MTSDTVTLTMAPMDTIEKRKAATNNEGGKNGDNGGTPKRIKAEKDTGATSLAAAAVNDAGDAEVVVEDSAVVRSSAGQIVSAFLSKHSPDQTIVNFRPSDGYTDDRTTKWRL